MSVLNNAAVLLLGAEAGGGGGYEISRSLRFNSSDSAYLSRTPGSAGNRKTWTWAGWVKLGALGTVRQIFTARTSGTPYALFYIFSDDKISFADNALNTHTTAAVYRDPSAWYHIQLTVDTTEATSANRVRLWVNGTLQTWASTTAPTQNADGQINTATAHSIGSPQPYASSEYFNGYLADIHFIDGQALTPSSFTEVSATTGQLIPKAYTGSYGTNGFHLPFSDNSTAAALGTDTSGNGNDWTVNNIQAAAPTYTYSSGWTANLLPGFPGTNCFNGTGTSLTIGGSSVASVWTAPTSLAFTELRVRGGHDGAQILINGVNVTSQFTAGVGWVTVTGVSSPLSTITLDNTSGAGNARISAVVVDGDLLVDGRPFKARDIDSLVDTPTSYGTDTGAGGEVRGNYCTLNPLSLGSGVSLANGNLDVTLSGSNVGALGTMALPSGKWYFEGTVGGTGSNVWIAIRNAANTQGYFYATSGLKSDFSGATAYGASSTTGDVLGVAFDNTAGTITFYKNGVSQGVAYSGISSTDTWFPYWYSNVSVSTAWNFNFGQRPFAYTAPSGFKALCDTNLPAPVVAQPSTVMDVVTRAGGGTTQTFATLRPGLVWEKRRDSASSHYLFDVNRGNDKYLSSNTTSAEGSTAGAFTFNTNSYTVSSGFDWPSGATVVDWIWDAGSSTVTNTQGSITSTVRANASAGFSIVTYTGTGSGATVGHGLGVAPAFIAVKNRGATGDWFVYHSGVASPASSYLLLNGTDAVGSSSSFWGSPNSATFGIKANSAHDLNNNTYVAYCFAPVAGYSSFGSYTGNGSADGPFVYTGFRPKFVLIKGSSFISNWNLLDGVRDSYNVADKILRPNLSNAEINSISAGSGFAADFLSNGFKLRASLVDSNSNAATFVWAAFAESPFQYARAR